VQIALLIGLPTRDVRIIAGGLQLTEDGRSLADLRLTPRGTVHITRRVKARKGAQASTLSVGLLTFFANAAGGRGGAA
jgi:hypothetical protein